MQTTKFRDIEYEVDTQGIATLTFNIPKRKNAMSALTTLEISWALEQFENNDSAFVMIITGAQDPANDNPAKQAFSSGGYFAPDAYDGLPDEIMQQMDFKDIALKHVSLKFFQCDKPIFAAVNGLAVGGGATLPLVAADQIYLSEHAWLQYPFAKLGIAAELSSTYLLPRLLGFHKAKELLFFAERIDAKKALELGLCTAVLPHEELMAYTRSQAEKIIPPRGAIQSIRSMKRCMHEPRVEELSRALDLENEALNRLFQSADFTEGMAARIERREPVFTGKSE